MLLNELRFEWDEEKNEINKRKHGISFETAIHIFEDENRIEIYDREHSIDEDRYNTIGLVKNVIFVVYTERGEAIRMISARPASALERSLYYGQAHDFDT